MKKNSQISIKNSAKLIIFLALAVNHCCYSMVESKRLRSLQARDNFPQHSSTKAIRSKTLADTTQNIINYRLSGITTDPLLLDQIHQAIIDKNFDQLGEILGNLNRDFYGNLGKAYFLRFDTDLYDILRKQPHFGKLPSGKSFPLTGLEHLDDWGWSLEEYFLNYGAPEDQTHISCTNRRITSFNSDTLPANLELLFLFYNRITKIPPLPANLNTLNLSYNRITDVPNLPANLTVLDLRSNEIQEISEQQLEALLQHPSLAYIELGKNPFNQETWDRLRKFAPKFKAAGKRLHF